MTRYFVVANGGHGLPLPILRGDDEDSEEIALFDTWDEAVKMAENQPLCSARGYEVIRWEHCEK